MRLGRFETVTLPFEATTVTGNEPAADGPPDAPATGERRATASAAAGESDETSEAPESSLPRGVRV